MNRIVTSVVILVLGVVLGIYMGKLGTPRSSLTSETRKPAAEVSSSGLVQGPSRSPVARMATPARSLGASPPARGSPLASGGSRSAFTAPPTAVPASTATPRPSPTPSPPVPQAFPTIPPPTATVIQSVAAEVLQQVAQVEAALQTGQFDVTINYSDGTRSVARVLFDLGDAGREPRPHISTTYEGAEGSRRMERITLGDRSWQSQPDGHWLATVDQEGVWWGQVQVFLPHAATVSSAQVNSEGNIAAVRWYEAGRDADVILNVDAATHIPQDLRQVTRGTDVVVTVIYSGWNMPVEITSPAGG